MELSIDTASEMASIAVSSHGRLVAEIAWQCRRNHSVELLPTIDQLLARAHCDKSDLTAVFVCTGPGGYTGLRVGMSVAKGLAFASKLRVAGVGRLELDAYPHAAFPGPIVAIHRAGRGELAWALYGGDPWRELLAPRLSKPEELPAHLEGASLIVGEIDDELTAAVADAGSNVVYARGVASVRRAGALAEIGFDRLSRGEDDELALVKPVYLRPPAIGPQPKAGA
ncbi:MAG: tRNA (adenosine(37)-N6)-threonylcarbamoyltransferase complex dimerization subunit type 1 TsaB [Chloroflexi bacterium]|nr:tRNA (adenosine(37)-N6)-threonylcarbamoyltransferase complex dimerization subunit type 1 TsaB [Chloroflexota bacterium]